LICFIIGIVVGLFTAVLFLGLEAWLAGPCDDEDRRRDEDD